MLEDMEAHIEDNARLAEDQMCLPRAEEANHIVSGTNQPLMNARGSIVAVDWQIATWDTYLIQWRVGQLI